MEKVALIGGELVSIPHELQGRLSGIRPIEQVPKILCCLLKKIEF
jgi:hypothetical protein